LAATGSVEPLANPVTSREGGRVVKRRLVPVIGLLALALAGPASAAPLEREHYSGTDSFDFDDCGFVIHNEVVYEGVFMLKAPREDGAPPRYFDNYHAIETLTANGRTATIEHQGLYKDLRITHVAGTVYQFVAMEAGRPFTARDGDGNVLIRDRGVLFTTFRVDTKGDSNLENDEFIEGSWSLLKDAGSHPGFYIDFCAEADAYFNG
jgi:hypothetical protein